MGALGTGFAGLLGLFGLLVCGGLVALVVVLAVRSSRRERARLERVRQWAVGQEWMYTPNPATEWPARLPGHNRRGVRFAVAGRARGHHVHVGAYFYGESSTTTGADGTSFRSSTTHTFVVVAVRFPQPPYQPIGVQPRGGLSKMGRALFGDERSVGLEQFDRQFRVTASDAAYARRMVGPALVQAHLSGAVPAWELYGNELLAYFPGRIDEPERIPRFTAPVLRVAELLGR
ncbi:hypothetical protein [Rhizomonospora bruguierae]|uniref:hypothetical protein n=1 Tax=Rhizomonospora bruguierae TaxID=1581705 RepID=UPI001BCE91B8|nr:hypothetical protein [Micromonospora sp. NBRC 107566]